MSTRIHATARSFLLLLSLLLTGASPPVPAQEVNTPLADLTVNGTGSLAAGPITYTAPAGTPIVLHLSSIAPTSAGLPMVLALNTSLAPGTFTSPSGQHLDLPLAGLEVHSAALPGLLESFFIMSPAATWALHFTRPATPAEICVQTAILDPALSPDGYKLSAAFSISLPGAIPTPPPICVPPPFSPIGGTILPLIDDSFVTLPLGFTFPFFGTPFTEVSVCSNGRLTFGGGSIDYVESETGLLTGLPSIDVFWDDLNPAGGGGAGYVVHLLCASPSEFAVVWSGIAEYTATGPGTGSNTGGVKIDASGLITMTYADCTLADAIVGISPGALSSPVPAPLDLTCHIAGAPTTAGCTTYGIVPDQSLYEVFTPASPFDLAGITLHFDPGTPGSHAYFIY